MSGLKCRGCEKKFDLEARRPRCLSCGHSVCTVCVNGLLEAGSVSCPICKATHKDQSGSLDGIPINYGVLSLLEAMAQTKAAKATLKAQAEKREANRNTIEKATKLRERCKALSNYKKDLKAQLVINHSIAERMTKLMNALDDRQALLILEQECVKLALQELEMKKDVLEEVRESVGDATTISELTTALQIAEDVSTDTQNIPALQLANDISKITPQINKIFENTGDT